MSSASLAVFGTPHCEFTGVVMRAAVLKFFETSTRNLLSNEAAAGVGHHVALSVVGTDRLSESGYFRARSQSWETWLYLPLPSGASTFTMMSVVG